MKWKSKLFLIWLILVIFYGCGLTFAIKGWKIKFISLKNSQITNQPNFNDTNQLQKIQLINYGSKFLQKKLVFPQVVYINNLHQNWKVLSFLNYYFTNWQKWYHINGSTLQTDLNVIKRIVYIPRKELLAKIERKKLNLTILNKITGLNDLKLNKQLLKLYYDNDDNTKIWNWLKKRITTNKKIQKIWKKLKIQIF